MKEREKERGGKGRNTQTDRTSSSATSCEEGTVVTGVEMTTAIAPQPDDAEAGHP